MLCPMCAHENPDHARYCKNCHAVLPRVLGLPERMAEVPLREGVEYLEPTHHYETEQIQRLFELVEDVLDGEDLFEELESHLEAMAANYKEFEEQHIGPMQEQLVQEAARLPDDDYNTQLSWVLKTGISKFNEGRDAFREFFRTESEEAAELEEAFIKVGDGHDFLCFGLELAQNRLALLQDIIAQSQQ